MNSQSNNTVYPVLSAYNAAYLYGEVHNEGVEDKKANKTCLGKDAFVSRVMNTYQPHLTICITPDMFTELFMTYKKGYRK